MFDFYQRRKIKAFLISPLTRIVLLILVLLMSWSAYTRYQKSHDMKGRKEEAQAQVKELEEQKQRLEERVRYLSDERGIEAEMRRQFDVALPDEQVVVIVEPEKRQATSSPLNKKFSDDPSWYEFWR